MNITRRQFALSATTVLGSSQLASLSFAQQLATPVAGKDYRVLEEAVATTAGAGKVEVLEFFSYACPHCHTFEPSLAKWVATLPKHVVFKRVPVPFVVPYHEVLTRTYYALEQTGQLDKAHPFMFTALHVDRQKLDKPEAVAAVVTKAGGDAKKFLAAYNSFSVATAVKKVNALVNDYQLDGVPALAIAGRYITSPQIAHGETRALQVASALIEKARKG